MPSVLWSLPLTISTHWAPSSRTHFAIIVCNSGSTLLVFFLQSFGPHSGVLQIHMHTSWSLFLFLCVLTSPDIFWVLSGCGSYLFYPLVLMQSWQPSGGHTAGIWCEFIIWWKGINGVCGEYLLISCFRLLLKFRGLSHTVGQSLCSTEYFLMVWLITVFQENRGYQMGIHVLQALILKDTRHKTAQVTLFLL